MKKGDWRDDEPFRGEFKAPPVGDSWATMDLQRRQDILKRATYHKFGYHEGPTSFDDECAMITIEGYMKRESDKASVEGRYTEFLQPLNLTVEQATANAKTRQGEVRLYPPQGEGDHEIRLVMGIESFLKLAAAYEVDPFRNIITNPSEAVRTMWPGIKSSAVKWSARGATAESPGRR